MLIIRYFISSVWAWVGNGVSDNLGKAADGGLKDNPDVIISRSHTGEAKSVIQGAFTGYKGIFIVNKLCNNEKSNTRQQVQNISKT